MVRSCHVIIDMEFLKDKHSKYLRRCLFVLPERLSALDVNRLTIAFFALSGLDLLNALEFSGKEKQDIIDWIYSLQVLPDSHGNHAERCGFRGSTANGVQHNGSKPREFHPYDSGHIAMTYTGLSCLLILGDDLNGVDKDAVIEGIRALQQSDGSYCALIDGSENDMRFVYCAACVCYILNDWRGMDVEKAVHYIQRSITYEGGIGQGPGNEAHGGSTFCAVAALKLMGRLHTTFSPKELSRLKYWCLMRQGEGFQGRPNKPEDACYTFWVGSTLKLLDCYDFVSREDLLRFVLSTQDEITGGFSKLPGSVPDPMHTYLAISGLTLMKFPGLELVHPALNISQRAVQNLEQCHIQSGNET